MRDTYTMSEELNEKLTFVQNSNNFIQSTKKKMHTEREPNRERNRNDKKDIGRQRRVKNR